ncbi:MAG: PaaI family thioesterase [Deltaproteobacteria bacterium]|nr:PaaI family thioesterase [Deltaproteobacteria bacterium]
MSDSRPPQPQPGSALCFVCGTQNPHGLGAVFYDDGKRVWTEVTPAEYHQGWPGVLHGGVVTAILDETIGRVAFLYDRWVQTAKIAIRFKRPAPLGELLVGRGELVRNNRRLMEMKGGLYVAGSDELLAEATGTFVPLPDAERNELAKQLGGDFAAWEQWLANNRMTEP